MKKTMLIAAMLAAVVAVPALAQDSVSHTGCLPGDAVSPWADSTSAFGSEQCNDYVVDMVMFTSSWGNTYGIAPLVKSGKTNSEYFTTMIAGKALSHRRSMSEPFSSTSYGFWTEPGYGINNDPALNHVPATIDTSSFVGHQFGYVFGDYGYTDSSASYNGVIGGFVNYLPSNPARLYVRRMVLATNSCDENSNVSQFGVGGIDNQGHAMVRVDGYGCSSACGLTPFSGNNIFRIDAANRNCDNLNVLSADYPGGMFDAGAIGEWIVQESGSTHGVPTVVPSDVTSGDPIFIGSNWDDGFGHGTNNGNVAYTWGYFAPGITGSRANLAYTPVNCGRLGSMYGISSMVGKDSQNRTAALPIWGLGANGAVTDTLAAFLPDPAVGGPIEDPITGWYPGHDTGTPVQGSFVWYYGQGGEMGYRSGNSPVAVGVDQQGRLLVACTAKYGDGHQTPLDFIAVARFDCDGNGDPTWSLAAFNDWSLGEGGTGMPVYNGDGTMIGRLTTFDMTHPAQLVDGPSFSAPMMDSVGNIYFLAPVEFFHGEGEYSYSNCLVRAVYNENLGDGNFGYTLEVMLRTGWIFRGANSDTEYQVRVLYSADFDGGETTGAPFSNCILKDGFMGMDTSSLSTDDPRTLGGLMLQAGIVYDQDGDGEFDNCETGSGDDDGQRYRALMYISHMPECYKYDLDNSGFVGTGDINLIKANYGECLEGDCKKFDLDGSDFVGTGDINLIKANYGECPGS